VRAPHLARRLSLALLLAAGFTAAPARARDELPIEAGKFTLVKRESGAVDYVQRLEEGGTKLLRASYRPGLETVVYGYQVEDADRRTARAVRWSWRTIALPSGGDECVKGKQDSAAVVYLTWKRGLRWYTLKFVWSAVSRVGAICDRRRNPFVAQDTIVLASGGPLGVWRDERVDLHAAFRKHFEDGNQTADVPSFVGIAIMSDGDQTQSASGADFARFVLER
jgi:hypothetical protein